jgi:colanic acid biosynthesis glycosyl transferase WcaI
MKILFVSQYFHPEPFSNGDIARALVGRGHEVDVICCVPNYPEGRFYPGYDNKTRREECWEGVNVVRVRTVPRGSRPAQLIANYLVYPPAAVAAWWRRRARRYDVSFTSMPSPIFQALVPTVVRALRGVPAVHWIQDIWPDSLINAFGIRNRALHWLLGAFCTWLYRRADVLLIQSEAFRPKLEAMGLPADRIAFLPNTSPALFERIDRDAVDPPVVEMLPQAKLRLMFAGNVGESQNLDVFIDAASRLPAELGIQWVVVGEGRDLARVKDRVAAAKIDNAFVFTGRQPMEMMPHFYAMADAMLVSLKDTEIFRMTVPFKLQSQLALGKPVIGSIGGEAKRIIDESHAGFCAEPDNVEDLVEVVRRFAATSVEEREAMAANAIAYFQAHYEADRVYTMLEDALRLAVECRTEIRRGRGSPAST